MDKIPPHDSITYYITKIVEVYATNTRIAVCIIVSYAIFRMIAYYTVICIAYFSFSSQSTQPSIDINSHPNTYSIRHIGMNMFGINHVQ